MNFTRFDQFEAFTDNSLSEAQQKVLEQQLADDATLRAEFDDYQQFRHSLEAVKLKQQLETIHTRLDRQGVLDSMRPASPLAPQPRFRRPLVWVLTGLLLAISGLYWATRPTLAERTFLTYYQPEPRVRGVNTCGPELTPGLQAYRSGDFGRARTLFSQLPNNQPCVQYYAGLTELALDNTSVAVDKLEQILNAGNATPVVPDFIRQKAEWYLALAYLKANQVNEARNQLTAIDRQPTHPFRMIAHKALADLQDE